MLAQPIIKNARKKHRGKYIATRSYKERVIIAVGENASKVYDLALKKGATKPFVIYIPKKDMIQLL